MCNTYKFEMSILIFVTYNNDSRITYKLILIYMLVRYKTYKNFYNFGHLQF